MGCISPPPLRHFYVQKSQPASSVGIFFGSGGWVVSRLASLFFQKRGQELLDFVKSFV